MPRSRCHPNSAQLRARCTGDFCSNRGAGVVLRYRLDPVNWRRQEALLCQRCAKAGGWTRVHGGGVLVEA